VDSQEPLVLEGAISIPYQWTTGPAVGRFLTDLRDHARLSAARCPGCGKIYVPPAGVCGLCHVRIDDLSSIPSTGTLQAFTVVSERVALRPKEPPYVLGLIKIDRADTCLLHVVLAEDPGSLRPGARVQAVFKAERQGDVTDIEGFKVLEG
jgi:uncharacterized OB-fold protein